MYRQSVARLAILCVAAAACGSTGATTVGAPPAASSAAASAPAQSVTEKLAFTGTTLSGQAFDGASLAGKDAVLWFWAPWCPKCAREAEHVAAAHAAQGKNVQIIGVPAFGTLPEMQKFTTNFKVDALTHVADPDGNIWRRFQVTEQPAYAFIDQSGAVELVRGEIGPEQLDAKLKELLAK